MVSFGGAALGNGSNNAIQLMKMGYFQSHPAKVPGTGAKLKASNERVYQFQQKLDDPAPAPTLKIRADQTRLGRAILEQSLLKRKPNLFSRWGKKVWGFFSLQKVRKIKMISNIWKRSDASQ